MRVAGAVYMIWLEHFPGWLTRRGFPNRHWS